MYVNIWSDIRCPFCYIGKHKFEKALEQFEHKDKVKIMWHSFELDPKIKTDPDKSDLDYLAESKGASKEQVQKMLDGAVKMGKEIGVTLNFEKSTVANSFNAHRLIQLAKANDLADEAEEALFEAHFKEGKNIDDKNSLREIGTSIGLKEADLDRMLFTDEYADKVEQDKKDAAKIGVNGVPFFVFNKKYAVSGAQPEDAFLEILEKSWAEYEEENQPLIVNKGQSCDTDGNCA